MPDFSDQYNTQLSPQETTQYNNWLKQQSQNVGRDLTDDHYDYDMQGWWKANKNVDLSGAHLTDQYKKPNHPTFSDQSQYHGSDNQGGQWQQLPNGSYQFVPGATNLKMFSPQQLQDYFSKVEPGNQLILK